MQYLLLFLLGISQVELFFLYNKSMQKKLVKKQIGIEIISLKLIILSVIFSLL